MKILGKILGVIIFIALICGAIYGIWYARGLYDEKFARPDPAEQAEITAPAVMPPSASPPADPSSIEASAAGLVTAPSSVPDAVIRQQKEAMEKADAQGSLKISEAERQSCRYRLSMSWPSGYGDDMQLLTVFIKRSLGCVSPGMEVPAPPSFWPKGLRPNIKGEITVSPKPGSKEKGDGFIKWEPIPLA